MEQVSVTLQRSVIEGLLNEIRYRAGFYDKIDSRVVGVDVAMSEYHVHTARESIRVCAMIIAWNLPLR
jgi:acyl-CoA reductase-like NAD-dependent aldehyde dehydrogenase